MYSKLQHALICVHSHEEAMQILNSVSEYIYTKYKKSEVQLLSFSSMFLYLRAIPQKLPHVCNDFTMTNKDHMS